MDLIVSTNSTALAWIWKKSDGWQNRFIVLIFSIRICLDQQNCTCRRNQSIRQLLWWKQTFIPVWFFGNQFYSIFHVKLRKRDAVLHQNALNQYRDQIDGYFSVRKRGEFWTIFPHSFNFLVSARTILLKNIDRKQGPVNRWRGTIVDVCHVMYIDVLDSMSAVKIAFDRLSIYQIPPRLCYGTHSRPTRLRVRHSHEWRCRSWI
jgi:hypothetical protein